MTQWTAEYEGAAFERFIESLPPYERKVLILAITRVLLVMGMSICTGEWGKPLGGGLYEFRIGKSLDAIHSLAGLIPPRISGSDRKVLLRIFCAFYGNRIVVIHHGYDKKRDSSPKRQQREISRARHLHAEWNFHRKS